MNHLTLENMEVMTTTNSQEVLDLVKEHAFDLIVLDIMMPHLSGYEVCEKLRDRKSTRLNSSHVSISYAVFCLKKKNKLTEHGDVLPAGETVLAGSLTRPMWVHTGDTVHSDYGELVAITCRFV